MLKEKYNLDSVFIPHGFNRPKFEKVESILNKIKSMYVFWAKTIEIMIQWKLS